MPITIRYRTRVPPKTYAQNAGLIAIDMGSMKGVKR
jgi:hypothetical protein